MSDDKEIDTQEKNVVDGGKEPIGEMVDRAERKLLKKKKKAEETLDKVDIALQQGRIAEMRKAKRKKIIKIGGSLVGVLVLALAAKSLFTPYKAGVSYGICKVFLETEMQFPQYLRYTGMQDFGDSVRIWYSRVDAFGEDRMETIRCYYKYDEARGSSIVDKITIDRREVDPRKIESFNRVLSVVLQNLPDLIYPRPLEGNNLRDLQIDPNAFRKPIL